MAGCSRLCSISIRAPARGATGYAQHYAGDGYISIRAPARGATIILVELQESVKFQSALPRGERQWTGTAIVTRPNFNPRSREGSDLSLSIRSWLITNFNPRSREGSDQIPHQSSEYSSISIRAPARGATRLTGSLLQPGGAFQSALPRGERQRTPILLHHNFSDFNPRSREGSDGASYTVNIII